MNFAEPTNKDNSAISVTLNGAKANDLPFLFDIKSGAALKVTNSHFVKIHDYTGSCSRNAIIVSSGSRFDMSDSTLDDLWVDPEGFATEVIWSRGDKVNLDRVVVSAFEMRLLNNNGSSSIANVVSTQIRQGGGFKNYGTLNIVNTAWETPAGSSNNAYMQLQQLGGRAVVEASTINSYDPECSTIECTFRTYNPTGEKVMPLNVGGGTLELSGSAVRAVEPFNSLASSRLLVVKAGSSAISDQFTWLMPRPAQDATALKALLPNVKTEDPAYDPNEFAWPGTVTPALGTTSTPGVLIDAIPDAGPGGVNELKSPIDNTPITVDAFGNPRVDANGARTIGAVQQNLAPNLGVLGTSNMTVDLSWSRPQDPGTGPITGYEVCFGTGITPNPSTLGTTCPATLQPISSAAATLTGQVTGLTNGTAYWFLVRGTNPTPGPWSNAVDATPVTVPGTPAVTATPGNGTVALSWSAPSDGGSPLQGYAVLYRLAGQTNWTVWPYSGTGTTVTIGGLTNGSPYEFAVSAYNGKGSGPNGTASTTPQALLFLQYPSTVLIEAGTGPLDIYPTFGEVVGTPTFILVSAPAGVTINASTGVVTAPNTLTVTGSLQPVTVQLIRSGPPAGSTQATFDLDVRTAGSVSPYLNYLNLESPAGSFVTLTPTTYGLTGPSTYSNLNPLPPGLSLPSGSTDGMISGTPTTVGFWNVDMQVVDSTTPTPETRLDSTVMTITPTLAYSNLNGQVGTPVSLLPQVPPLQSGHSYTYAISGARPSWVQFNTSTGEISGTPDTNLSSAVDVTVSVVLPTGTFTASTHVSLSIASRTISFSYPSSSSVIGKPINLSPTVSGLVGPAVYTECLPFPTGVTLNRGTGQITGTMTSALVGQLLCIQVTDGFGSQTTTVTLTASAPPPNPIPTLGEWAQVMMMFMMIATAGFYGWRLKWHG